ncbi:MAG: hypothetical protein ACOYER_10445 [Limnochordia bacterium]|nr:hypothetical protein [Bacillota bacterium]HBG10196.1 hypothetical protein [Bacillota bacterium]
MKRFALLALLLAAVLFTGCLSPKVNFKIEPNPIEVTVNQTALTGIKLKVTLSGFSLAYTVEAAVVELYDDEGELVFTTTEEIDITIPVVSGIGETIDLPDVSLSEIYAEIDPAFTEAIYNEKLLGKTYKLKITLTGKNPTEDTADIIFK